MNTVFKTRERLVFFCYFEKMLLIYIFFKMSSFHTKLKTMPSVQSGKGQEKILVYHFQFIFKEWISKNELVSLLFRYLQHLYIPRQKKNGRGGKRQRLAILNFVTES